MVIRAGAPIFASNSSRNRVTADAIGNPSGSPGSGSWTLTAVTLPVGTVSAAAATLLKVRSRDVLLPVILYPLLVPLFVAGTRVTGALIGEVPNLEQAWFWIRFLGIYDAVFLVLSLWTFESLVIE